MHPLYSSLQKDCVLLEGVRKRSGGGSEHDPDPRRVVPPLNHSIIQGQTRRRYGKLRHSRQGSRLSQIHVVLSPEPGDLGSDATGERFWVEECHGTDPSLPPEETSFEHVPPDTNRRHTSHPGNDCSRHASGDTTGKDASPQLGTPLTYHRLGTPHQRDPRLQVLDP